MVGSMVAVKADEMVGRMVAVKADLKVAKTVSALVVVMVDK